MRRRLRAGAAPGCIALLVCSSASAQIFFGTTPCGASVRVFLDIPARAECEVVRWDVWLSLNLVNHQNQVVIKADYGVEGQKPRRIQRDGRFSVEQGTPEHPDGAVLELRQRGREIQLWRVGGHTLHFLDEDRNLLVGDSRHGYTLATAFAAKPKPEPPLTLEFTPVPQASDATVFGRFEGRTPCGLSQVLGIPVPASCDKLTWRLTLFQEPRTLALTSYRLEGGLLRDAPREGTITHLVSTSFNRDASVLKLEAAEGQQPLYLMRGDDNVFFFVDRTGTLGVGDRESGYVLYRQGLAAPKRPGDPGLPDVAARRSANSSR